MSRTSAERIATPAAQSVRSMTGQGHAQRQADLGTVSVEIRTVNNRGFKLAPRFTDSLSTFESKIESFVRSRIKRGTVQLNVTWRQPAGGGLPQIDIDAVCAYHEQLQIAQNRLGDSATIDLTRIVNLPGVLNSSREDHSENAPLYVLVEGTVSDAIDNLNEMRGVEGSRMADSLQSDCDEIRKQLSQVETLAPRTVDAYRSRLEAKIRRTLDEHKLDVDSIDILREVQIYADRSDISEEITRLASHLLMFNSVVTGEHAEASGGREPVGRKLDFITQEMFRETNTIGSKASDAEISASVVEIKCAIERMRELVQNLE